jgi:hypothetical protein
MAAVTQVVATPRSIDGMAVSGQVANTAEAFWYGQMNRDGICGMLSGCVGASGADPNWVFQIAYDVPGLGLQTIPVNVTVTQQDPPTSLRLAMAFDATGGSLRGDVRLSIRPVSNRATVSMEVVRVETSGFASAALPQIQADLPAFFASELTSLSSEPVMAGTKVAMTVVPGKVAKVRVKVTGASLTRVSPVASGVLRVLVGSKIVCTGKVARSAGTCSFTPPPRGSAVRAVVTGAFSNGYQIWNSAQARYRP